MSRGEKIIVFGLAILFVMMGLFLAATSDASCGTHKCWHKVHVTRVERMIQHRIDVITPYQCGPEQSVVPCKIINHESSMCGYWRALNGCHGYDGRTPCLTQACGLYQFLGWNVPWPVIVPHNKLRTLSNKLKHHRQAARMSLSNW